MKLFFFFKLREGSFLLLFGSQVDMSTDMMQIVLAVWRHVEAWTAMNIIYWKRRSYLYRGSFMTGRNAIALRSKVGHDYHYLVQTRALVAVEPHRPPKTNMGTETAFRHNHCKHIQKRKHLWGQDQLIRSKSRLFSTTSIYMLSVTYFDPKGTISEVRVHAGANLDMLVPGRSPNAVRVHAGTSQVVFEVDRPPPAASPGDLLISMVKETAKKSFERNEKKSETCSYLSLIW